MIGVWRKKMTNEVVPTIEMTVDLTVLEHLGINLYSDHINQSKSLDKLEDIVNRI